MNNPSSERPIPAPGTAPTPATPGMIRSINDRVVLDLLVEHGTLSRGDVRRLTGVSKPTASQSLTRLEESGHVLQSGFQETTHGGRASLIYELNPRAGFAGAIDVTTEGVHAQVADVRGTVIGEHRTHSGAGTSTPETALESLVIALENAGLEYGSLSAIVVAASGSYDPETDTLNFAGHLPGWQAPGLVKRLETATGVRVHIENDVNLVAMAEHRLGAVQGVGDFFLLWADEGIGGALMIGDRLYRGSTGAAGEVAFLLPPGVPVVRNPVRENRGGFEDLVGSAHIVVLGREHGLAGDTAEDLVRDAVASESDAARAFLVEIAARFATGLASVIALFDPAVIVLAGSIMNAGGDALVARIAEQVGELAIRTPHLTLGQVATEPVIAGAQLVSLEHTRNVVFST